MAAIAQRTGAGTGTIRGIVSKLDRAEIQARYRDIAERVDKESSDFDAKDSAVDGGNRQERGDINQTIEAIMKVKTI